MSDLHPQVALLIRYVDNQASEPERRQVEQLAAADESAASLLTKLEKTRLPLMQGIDPALPPANQQMVDLVNDWQPAASNSQPASRQFGLLAMAATLAFGVVAGHLLTNFASKPENSGTGSTVMASDTTPEWIRLVADYHRLYTRETVAGAPKPDISAVTTTVSNWLVRDTRIPDLSSVGISFSRAQQLAVNDDILVQLAYLPATDKPIAVCIRKTRSARNTPVRFDNYGGMEYAEWQDGNHAVVIVGDISARQLQQIAATVNSTLFAAG